MKAFAIVSNGVAVLGLLSASAVAQQPKQTVDDLPGPLESVKELQNSARMVFMLADENNDGQISQKEARDAANLVAGGFFFRADKNGDGTLSKEEAKEARDAFLNTKPWIKYAVETVRVNAPRNAAAAGESSRGNNVDMIASFEAAFDANNDGQLQASELRQAVQTTVQAAFDQADTNRDGQLSPAELNAAVAGLSRQAAQLAFREADSDNNGQISQAEFEKAILKPVPRGVRGHRPQPRRADLAARGTDRPPGRREQDSLAELPRTRELAAQPDQSRHRQPDHAEHKPAADLAKPAGPAAEPLIGSE